MAVATVSSVDDILASDQVPSLPEVALRVIQIAQQPDPDTQDLVRTIRTDPAIAGRVLKFANSALFGVRNRPSSIDAAVPLLGTTLVRTLVLGFSLARQTNTSETLKPWFRQLWRESLFQAAAAEYLAERSGKADAPTWFLGGLLQDVGQLAMLNAFDTDYVDRVLNVRDSRCRVDREFQSFGFSHVDISVALCRRWNLESSLIEAIASHHSLPAMVSPELKSKIAFGLGAAASCSEYMDAINDRLAATRSDVERCLIEGYSVMPQDLFQVLAEIDVRSTELAGGFSVDIGHTPPRERILAMAQSTLRSIAMEQQLRNVDKKVAAASTSTKVPAGRHSADDEPFDKTAFQEWFDDDSDVYNEKYLKSAVPLEICKAHAQGVSIGFLQIDLAALKSDEAANGRPDFERIASVLKDCVRPSDHVARFSDLAFLVILPGLNYDLLSRIAESLMESLADYLDLPTQSEATPVVGGVVVVPSSRKPAATEIVLSTLDASTKLARSADSKIVFQLVVGTKAQPVA